MTGWRVQVVLWAGLGSSLLGAAPAAQESDDARRFDAQFRPLLVRHCISCHGRDKPKGKLRLDNLAPNFADAVTRARWTSVIERLKAGEMPPKGKSRPSPQDVEALTDWLAPRVAAVEASEGRVVLRRLNRVDYENTVRDLLGITIHLKEQLPADGAADGFDNASAANHTSSFLMEKYLEAADTALGAAIAGRPKPPPSITKRHSIKDGWPVRGTTENVYRFLKDGEVVCFCSSEWHSVGATEFYPMEGGLYRFRISASAFQSKQKPLTFRVVATGTSLTGKSGLVGYFDAPPDKPTVYEFVRYMEPRTTIMMLPYGLARSDAVHKVGGEKWDGPGLAVQYIEVEGPLNPTWPSESHRRLFGDLPQKTIKDNNYGDRAEVVSDRPLVDAEVVLKRFMRGAFRRTVTTEDVAPYVAIVDAKLKDGYSFEAAIRAALKGVMISPEFLFLRERPGTLDDFALASRLSYFLWSTMPDEALFSLAEQRALSRPDVLHEQVERMLASPKAVALTDNFVGQWLGLREIDATEPSHILYPEFDHLLKVSMIRETELFFDEVLKNDLSVTNFIASDFTMVNGRLAKHYGIPGVEGWEFHKAVLPSGSHRGGVLTMASVLKVTANGTTTSPVLRGAWVMDRILGTRPPPPPDDVPAIDPDIRGAQTIREQLARHRATETCGACHRKIDPPGFALESFDCIGGWRDYYRATGLGQDVFVDGRRMPYLKGKKVDPADVTADGDRFRDIDQLKQILVRDEPRLARALATKLITYATGRAPRAPDRDAVDAIVAKTSTKRYGLRSLIHEIVQSELFRNK
jgi:mono/diheme cytochrome c family protein